MNGSTLQGALTSFCTFPYDMQYFSNNLKTPSVIKCDTGFASAKYLSGPDTGHQKNSGSGSETLGFEYCSVLILVY